MLQNIPTFSLASANFFEKQVNAKFCEKKTTFFAFSFTNKMQKNAKFSQKKIVFEK